MDEDKVVHRAFSCKVESKLGFIKPQVWASFASARLHGLKAKPPQGDMYQLGGTFVIDTSRDKKPFIFIHRQSRWGDHPEGNDVLDAVLRANATAEKVKLSADVWILRHVIDENIRHRKSGGLRGSLRLSSLASSQRTWGLVFAVFAIFLYLRS